MEQSSKRQAEPERKRRGRPPKKAKTESSQSSNLASQSAAESSGTRSFRMTGESSRSVSSDSRSRQLERGRSRSAAQQSRSTSSTRVAADDSERKLILFSVQGLVEWPVDGNRSWKSTHIAYKNSEKVLRGQELAQFKATMNKLPAYQQMLKDRENKTDQVFTLFSDRRMRVTDSRTGWEYPIEAIRIDRMDQGSTKVTIFWPLQLREEGDRRVYKKEKTHKQLERKITNLTKKIKKLRKAGKTVSSDDETDQEENAPDAMEVDEATAPLHAVIGRIAPAVVFVDPAKLPQPYPEPEEQMINGQPEMEAGRQVKESVRNNLEDGEQQAEAEEHIQPHYGAEEKMMHRLPELPELNSANEASGLEPQAHASVAPVVEQAGFVREETEPTDREAANTEDEEPMELGELPQ